MPLTELERNVYEDFLVEVDGLDHIMTPLQCKKLLREAQYDEVPEGSESVRLLERGQTRGDIFLVVRGEPEVRIDERYVVRGKPGLFGEMSLIFGRALIASVHATPGCAYFRWSRENLELFLEEEKDIARGFQHLIGREVSRKLIKMHEQRQKEQAEEDELGPLRRITSKDLAQREKKRGLDEIAWARSVEPFFQAGLWKLSYSGDRRRSEDWIYLDMWIGIDGTLFYWSAQQQAPLVYWTADDIAQALIRKTDGDGCHSHGFQVSPDEDFTCAAGEFAADSEELRECWIDALTLSKTRRAVLAT